MTLNATNCIILTQNSSQEATDMTVPITSTDTYKRNAFTLPQPFHHFNLINLQGQYLKSHSHDRFHLNLITKGSLKVITKDGTLTVTEGNAYIMPPGVKHELVSENGYSQIGMDLNDILDKNDIVQHVRDICKGKATKVKMGNVKLTEYISDKNLLDSSSMSKLKYISLMTTLLLLIIENAQKKDEDENFRTQFIEAAKKYAAKGVNLDELCKEFNFSKTHIERLSKKEFGCSAIKYIEHLRFLNICSLLTNTTKKLSEIAEECGFCDSSHLSVFFKKHCGKTPAKFRKDDI